MNAPLNEWVINQAFDSADSCETVRLTLLQSEPDRDPAVQERRRHMICIATDDSRLKEK